MSKHRSLYLPGAKLQGGIDSGQERRQRRKKTNSGLNVLRELLENLQKRQGKALRPQGVVYFKHVLHTVCSFCVDKSISLSASCDVSEMLPPKEKVKSHEKEKN